MKREKLSFWKKMYLVITDFRTYPFLVKHEKISKAIRYFLTLVMLLSLVFLVYAIYMMNQALTVLLTHYDELVPEFYLKQDSLDVPKQIERKIEDNMFLLVDTRYTYQEFQNTDGYEDLIAYDLVLLVNQDQMTIESNKEALGFVLFNQNNLSLDRDSLWDALVYLRQDFSWKLIVVVTVFIVIFLSLLAFAFTRVLFITLLVGIMCMFRGIFLGIFNYLKVAIYVYTLPLVLVILVGIVAGFGKSYTYYATVLLTYVYLIYAIRAIRLDAFIMMFSRKNAQFNPAQDGQDDEIPSAEGEEDLDTTKDESNQNDENKEE